MSGSNTLSGKFQVKIAGKSYSCHLSMNAFRMLCESEYLKFAEMQPYLQDKPLTAVPKVIYFGMVNAMHLSGKSADDLPSFDLVAAHILEKPKNLEEYTRLIAIAFGGEDEDGESGNE